MERKKRTVIIVVAVLAGIAVAAALCLLALRQGHSLDAEHDEHLHGEALVPDEHEDEGIVRLSAAELEEFAVRVDTIGAGRLEMTLRLTGEIVPNPDRLAHIVPRVAGIVREVQKNLGDEVSAGEVMAVLESRELADAKSAYLAAQERAALAEAVFSREENLWKRKISSEQDYLEAKRADAEARIALRAAEQKLHALGFDEDYVKQLPRHPDESFTRYEIVAPFDGEVIKKHITLGEVLKNDAEAFVIADLSSVWANLSVYQKDLALVRVGQEAVIWAGNQDGGVAGSLSYISPLVGKGTRTATARVVLPNPDGSWRPGLFVTARVVVDTIEAPLVVPVTALQTIDGQQCVFVETDEGFEVQAVEIGRTDASHIEIKQGIEPGQRYVTEGAFTLKSELQKEAFGEGHGH